VAYGGLPPRRRGGVAGVHGPRQRDVGGGGHGRRGVGAVEEGAHLRRGMRLRRRECLEG